MKNFFPNCIAEELGIKVSNKRKKSWFIGFLMSKRSPYTGIRLKKNERG